MGIKEKVKAFIEKENLIQKGDRILLGLSGGADSVCLFYLFLTLREELAFTLRTVHIHHGIREEADKDASYTEALCKKEDVPCFLFREDVPAYAKMHGVSKEEAGRTLRYLDFQKTLQAWQKEETGDAHSYKIATAHHANDQAETVLFWLFRGCGLSGLRGILPMRGNIIRPLLCLSRAEIEAYLKEKGLSWREDETNASADYSRNKIRHQILPYAEAEICSGAISHIGKTAQIVREAEAYLKKQAEAAYAKLATERTDVLSLDIAALEKEDVFLQKQILLYGLEKLSFSRKDIGAAHIETILHLIKTPGNGRLSLPGEVRIQKLYEKLLISRGGGETEDAAAVAFFPKSGGFLYGAEKPNIMMEQISLADEDAVKKRFGIQNISEIMQCIPQKTYTKWFDYDKIKMPLSIRHWKSGDYLTIDEKMHHKSIRRYMIEAKIPASQREGIWLLADESHIIWMPGGRMSAYYKVTQQTKTILQIQVCMED